MPFRVLLLFIFSLHSFGFSQIQNILIPKPVNSTYTYGQVEPSIFINPKDTSKIIAGSVLDDYYWSTDGGRNWKSKTMHAKPGVYGDPCMLIDTAETYFYFHMSGGENGAKWLDKMVCQKSDQPNGKWSESYTSPNGKIHDKEWATVDRRNNNLY